MGEEERREMLGMWEIRGSVDSCCFLKGEGVRGKNERNGMYR